VAELIDDVCARLEQHKAPEGAALPGVPATYPDSAIP
jgi:hypothetical protein